MPLPCRRPGAAARRGNGIWRVHSAFDLPAERFTGFAVSEEIGGERLDRIAVALGEIRIADWAYMQPDRVAAVLAAGGDEPPPDWWTPLVSFARSGKVSNGSGIASFYG